jgi:hypothetical protein
MVDAEEQFIREVAVVAMLKLNIKTGFAKLKTICL